MSLYFFLLFSSVQKLLIFILNNVYFALLIGYRFLFYFAILTFLYSNTLLKVVWNVDRVNSGTF